VIQYVVFTCCELVYRYPCVAYCVIVKDTVCRKDDVNVEFENTLSGDIIGRLTWIWLLTWCTSIWTSTVRVQFDLVESMTRLKSY
jgi:hypothetical protein